MPAVGWSPLPQGGGGAFPSILEIFVPLRLEACGVSHVGKVRKRNEDTFLVESPEGLLLVADGMGGAPAGDLASSTAVEVVARGLRAGQEMKEAVDEANRAILRLAESDPARAGMGTTLTALQISATSGAFVLGHVGDSRAYRRTGEGVRQITTDHTLVQEMVEAGKIHPELAKDHPFGHILSQALGTQDRARPDVIQGQAGAGEAFLLCSDGLMKVMDDQEIEEWVTGMGPGSLEEIVKAMLDVGLDRGAPDNITLAAVVLT